MNKQTKKAIYITQALLLLVVPVFISASASAAVGQLLNRSIVTSTSVPAAQSNHVIAFDIPASSSIGSISFEHCTNSPLIGMPCAPPNGLSLLSATLVSQSGSTGFTKDIINSSANMFVITRPSVASVAGPNSFTIGGVINPNISNQTTYIRVTTYASVDLTGAVTDFGAVAYSTNGGFSVAAFVPPILVFCTGVTVSMNCSSYSGDLLTFGELSPTQTRTATSQFSGSTNDPTGYNVFIDGQTMTAGNQIIPPLFSGGGSIAGVSQFGINLRANSAPSVGAEPSGLGTSFTTANYGTPNLYRFVSGELLASANTSTEFNLKTVSYVVNVANNQAPGYYATTMTYIAIASF